jgi:ATP-dependent DNA helicase DinG
MLAARAGVRMLHVPYRSSPLAVQDLITGRVDVFVADQAVILPAARSGQLQMVATIDQAIAEQTHGLIQAGTGTGKSLGYLAPIIAHLIENPDGKVIVATATLALQTQLATKDIPTVMGALDELGLDEVSWAVLKGGSNYPCLLKIRDLPADPADQQYALEGLEATEDIDASADLAKQVVGLRAWAERMAKEGVIADRDEAPSHAGKAWSQIAISGRECVGPVCSYIGQCFVQAARERAALSQLVITNHALIAIEASHGWASLNPDLLVLDEAHELASRVTTSRTDELSPQMVDRAVRMTAALLKGKGSAKADRTDFEQAAEHFTKALEACEVGRVSDEALFASVDELRGAARRALSALGRDSTNPRQEQVSNVVKEIFEICERISSADESEVIWVSERPLFGPQLVVAPLRVAATIRSRILSHQTTILTSATLKLGNSFDPIISTIGLGFTPDLDADEETEPLAYTAIDVGSPFDYQSQGICYVAEHLPPPGRDGIADQALVEIAELVQAAGGHTLGLFSSMRSAQRAADFVRQTTDREVLVQGEGHLPELIARFLAEPTLSLFGTISLWQGIDAPGDTCNLVIVDRIPFPRPDEPLLQARQADVSRHGGNGFMQVAAQHAGLMLAQGTGRLIRTTTDRGVVAILDSRLVKARYGAFLASSMPPLWMTTDRGIVLAALTRLNGPTPN